MPKMQIMGKIEGETKTTTAMNTTLSSPKTQPEDKAFWSQSI